MATIAQRNTQKQKIGLNWGYYLNQLKTWPWELLVLLIGFGWLYRQTMPPGMSSWIIEGWDSAMFQITGSTWGIPHSPGYPLYTIISNLYVRILGIIPGFSDTPIVWRVTAWSTATSLLTLVFLYATVRKLSRSRTAALLATSILALSFIFWRGAIMAEVYSLNALIFVLTYWLALKWDTDPRNRWLVILGLVLGAGLAHHRTAFILPPTIALWVLIKRPKSLERTQLPYRPGKRWKLVLQRWLILGSTALIPLLSYLYLPLASQRQGQTWIYADASDWNTFWFIVVSREWWGLVQSPQNLAEWGTALTVLFNQQADQITILSVLLGLIGLLLSRRYLALFGPPLLGLIYFGVSYKVTDLDSMLIPLTLTLCVGLGYIIGLVLRTIVTLIIRNIRVKDEVFRGTWLSPVLQTVIALALGIGAYFFFQPLAKANFTDVNLSGDWQAFDLVEEVVTIGSNGTPLTIIGQDNSVLPDFIYAKTLVGDTITPRSTTTLARMPEAESQALIEAEFTKGHRVMVDIETIDLNFIPWLSEAIETENVFLAPTGHPYLWEILPRPQPAILPQQEFVHVLGPGQFLDGQVSVVAHHQQIIQKRTGCFLRLTLFWQAKNELADDYYIAVQPLGGETVLDKKDHLALMRGYLATSDLRPNEIIRDEFDLIVREPAALPSIQLVVNLYQVQGNEFPTFGQVTLPITVDSQACLE